MKTAKQKTGKKQQASSQTTSNFKKYLLIALGIAIIVSIILIQKTRNEIQGTAQKVELTVKDDSARVTGKSLRYAKAIELVTPDGYINTGNKPITIAQYIGKNVILVDFWTYSCINCQRTLPYLNAWYEKYHDRGLVIIGVHTPEFDFEKDKSNVQRAVEKYGVKYPVVQDNQYQTWTAYGNHYWPHKYLIDIDGFIAYDHIGEGNYDETEKKIQRLLEERNTVLKLNESVGKEISKPHADTPGQVGTPEIYFGYAFSRNQFGNSEGWQPEKTFQYRIPEKLQSNLFYLEGSWLNNKDNMELAGNNGSIALVFFAKKVHLVAGARTPTEVTVYVDGTESKKVMISSFDLYTVVSLDEPGAHTLEIKADTPGLMAYTFTFG